MCLSGFTVQEKKVENQQKYTVTGVDVLLRWAESGMEEHSSF